MSDQTTVRIMAIIMLPFVIIAMTFYGLYKCMMAALELIEAGIGRAVEWVGAALHRAGVIK